MTKQERMIEEIQMNANKLISQKLKEAYGLIAECEEIAKGAEIHFSFDLSYGMGGTFDPHDGWQASSQSC